MSKKSFRQIVIVLALVVLMLPAFAEPNPIICTPGNKWEYDRWKLLSATIQVGGKAVATLHDASSGSSVYEVLSEESETSPVVYNYREIQNMKSTNGGTSDTISDLRITSSDDGLRIFSVVEDSSNEKEVDTQTYDPPLFYFNKAAISGKSWEVGMMRSGDIKSFVNAKGAGRETVTVPAGTFENCLKLVYSSDDISGSVDMWGKDFTITSGRRRGIYWIADGVGVVKEMEVVTSGAEALGPDGKLIELNTALCSIGELKPGYVIN